MIIQLALAPLTLAMAAALMLIAKVSRWRPIWLIIPAIVGVGWTAVIGADQAAAGWLLVSSRLARLLTGPVPATAHMARFALIAATWRHALPGQVPIAMIAAAAQARAAAWLAADQGFRPGVIVAGRRACVRAALRRGEVATPDGCRVGLIPDAGRPVPISWEEARGGVLITGSDLAPVGSTGLGLAIAAIQHRKTTIIVDLTAGDTGSRETLAASVIAACTASHAPLAVLNPASGRYDPFSSADPQRAADLVSAMVDWASIDPQARPACERLLREAVQVIAAGQPAPGGPQEAVLDQVEALVRPAGLLAAPAVGAVLAAQLGELRSVALGARLSRHGPGAGKPIDLARALARRECVVFCLDRNAHGRPGAMVARLVLADLARVLADRAELGSPADCLVLVIGCEPADLDHVAALLAAGPAAGSAIAICTAASVAATTLSSAVNVVAVRGRPPPAGSTQVAAAGAADTAAGEILFSDDETQEVPTVPLRVQRSDELTFLVRSPRARVVAGCRAAR